METKEAAKKIKNIPGGIEKVKALFKELFSEEAVQMSEVKLKDGSVIMIDGEPAVGASVKISTSDGELPAPDGEHMAEDGSVIVVKDGKITEIKQAETKPEDAPVKMSEDIEKRFKDLEEKYETRIKVLEDKLTETEKQFKVSQEKMKAQSEIQKETFALVEAIAELPVSSSVKQVSEIEKREDRFSAILEGIKKIKERK